MTILKAAVIGDPISHSLSPKLHGFLLQKYQINGEYKAIHVTSKNLENAVNSMIEEGYQGFNVTIPHKESIFKFCDFKTENAELTKAVNTVTITQDKKLIGDNSDSAGFLNNLKFFHPNFDLTNKTAFVIGAGGAARAIVYALLNSDVKNIYITNRSQEKAEILINDFKDFAAQKSAQLKFLNHEDFEKNLDQCDLLTNSTSLGMINQAELKLDLQNLHNGSIVYDIVYKPLMTDLLKNAKKRQNKIVTGIGMLAFQAAVGFENWFGKKPQIDEELINYLTDLL